MPGPGDGVEAEGESELASLQRQLEERQDRLLRALADADNARRRAQRELRRALEKTGVTRYSALGQRFDPTLHEAVARRVSVTDAPDTVVAEVAPGYLLNGRVVRPALVAVAAAPDEGAA